MFQLTVMSQWNHMVRSQDDFTVKKCEVTFWGHGKVNIVSSHFFWTHGVMFQLTVMSQWNHKLTSQDDFTTKKCEVTFWGHSKTHIVRSSNFFGELDMSQTWDQIVDWVMSHPIHVSVYWYFLCVHVLVSVLWCYIRFFLPLNNVVLRVDIFCDILWLYCFVSCMHQI